MAVYPTFAFLLSRWTK